MGIPWWVGVFVLVLWLVLTRMGRIVGVIMIVVLILMGLHRVFFRSAGACTPTGGPCRTELQPRWAGPCFSSSGGAIGLDGGRYFLLSDGSTAAAATCFDIRFYR